MTELLWSAQGLVEGRLAAPQIVDSWLVDDGHAIGYLEHQRRFAAACPPIPAGFWAAVSAACPGSGAWFPRVEWSPAGFGLRLRPAPPRRRSARAILADDPRTAPLLKGPDLDALAALRAHAQRQGADDALLLRDGVIVEAAHAGLLWWDDDTLCLPAPGAPTLPSITVELLLRHADDTGTPTQRRPLHAEELADHEVWLVNSLHGIRTLDAAPSQRADDWQCWWQAQAQPLGSWAS